MDALDTIIINFYHKKAGMVFFELGKNFFSFYGIKPTIVEKFIAMELDSFFRPGTFKKPNYERIKKTLKKKEGDKY